MFGQPTQRGILQDEYTPNSNTQGLTIKKPAVGVSV